jgi:tetratricopeptide (TPR) repeat protein
MVMRQISIGEMHIQYPAEWTMQPNLDANAFYVRGIQRAQSADLSGAIADLTEAIHLDPERFDAHLARGMAYTSKGSFDEAIADLTEAIRLNASAPNAYYARANARGNNHDLKGAVKDYGEAIRLKPTYAEALARRGLTHLQLGYRDAATADLKRALELNPKLRQMEIIHNAIEKLRHPESSGVASGVVSGHEAPPRQSPMPAPAVLRKAPQPVPVPIPTPIPEPVAPALVAEPDLGPDAPDVEFDEHPTAERRRLLSIKQSTMSAVEYLARGIMKFEANDPEGALVDFAEAIYRDAACIDAYVNRGAVYLAIGDEQHATEDFRKALHFQPNHPDAATMRQVIERAARGSGHGNAVKPGWQEFEEGNFRLANQDARGAISKFNEAIKVNPKEHSYYAARGLAYQEKADLRSAIADFDRAIRLEPKLAENYIKRGDARALKEDYRGAVGDYTEALKLDERNILALMNRGKTQAERNDFKNAAKDFSEVIQLDPKNAEAYGRRGLARVAMKDLDGADADCDMSTSLRPGQPEATELVLALEKARAKKARR